MDNSLVCANCQCIGFGKFGRIWQFQIISTISKSKSNHFVKNLKISNQIKWKKSQIQINSKLIWFLANPNHPNQILFKIMKPIKKKLVYSRFFTQLVNCHCTKLIILSFFYKLHLATDFNLKAKQKRENITVRS